MHIEKQLSFLLKFLEILNFPPLASNFLFTFSLNSLTCKRFSRFFFSRKVPSIPRKLMQTFSILSKESSENLHFSLMSIEIDFLPRSHTLSRCLSYPHRVVKFFYGVFDAWLALE